LLGARSVAWAGPHPRGPAVSGLGIPAPAVSGPGFPAPAVSGPVPPAPIVNSPELSMVSDVHASAPEPAECVREVMTANDRIPQVLVVDDEPNIRELVQVALKFHGCAVSTAASGTDALRQAESARPDLIVLDVVLPDIDGFEVCRRLRAGGNEVPVIFLTARDTSSDTVTGLALGGDDYVTKPFSVEALVARVRAVLRRASRSVAADADTGAEGILRIGDLELDESRWSVYRAGVPVELSPTEFRLLAYLMRHQGRVLTRAQLLENVWGWDYAGQSQIVETYVSYLRRKLDPLGPPLIHTQRGVGYSLRLPGQGGPGDAAGPPGPGHGPAG
jgi:two-component system, OmpR family, response regulator